MKLRIKDNTLRLRVSRSDLDLLIQNGRVNSTIYFSGNAEDKWTYAIEMRSNMDSATLRYRPTEVLVLVPDADAKAWAGSDQVGIYASCQLGQGQRQRLEILVEKDFACLDLSDAQNEDTFPNPAMGVTC
jgi:hypothetical protein